MNVILTGILYVAYLYLPLEPLWQNDRFTSRSAPSHVFCRGVGLDG